MADAPTRFTEVDTEDGYKVNGVTVIDENGNVVVGTTIKMDDGDAIIDTNDNDLLEFGVTASAVNHLKITNAATGTDPLLSAVGDDTNINITLVPKGTGLVNIVSNDDGTTGAVLLLEQHPATQSADDCVGVVRFQGEDDGGNDQIYGEICGLVDVTTDGSEAGGVILKAAQGDGTLAEVLGAIHDGTTPIVEVGDGTNNAIITNPDGALTIKAEGTNDSLFLEPNGNGVVSMTTEAVILSGASATAGGAEAVRIGTGASGVVGVYFGSGAPTVAAPQGSLYMRTDGSSTSTRMYVNTDGSTTWTNVTTAA